MKIYVFVVELLKKEKIKLNLPPNLMVLWVSLLGECQGFFESCSVYDQIQGFGAVFSLL
jgi:hypothetical protein